MRANTNIEDTAEELISASQGLTGAEEGVLIGDDTAGNAPQSLDSNSPAEPPIPLDIPPSSRTSSAINNRYTEAVSNVPPSCPNSADVKNIDYELHL